MKLLCNITDYMFNKQFLNYLGFILTDIFEIVPSLLFILLEVFLIGGNLTELCLYMSPIHHMKILCIWLHL